MAFLHFCCSVLQTNAGKGRRAVGKNADMHLPVVYFGCLITRKNNKMKCFQVVLVRIVSKRSSL